MRRAELEVDRRQNDLEVDEQDELPMASQYLADQPERFVPSHVQDVKEVPRYSDKVIHDDKTFNFRKATFRLNLALAIVAILGVVGVGIAGSLAAKRGGLVCEYSRYMTRRVVI